jgi:hypothetical protein
MNILIDVNLLRQLLTTGEALYARSRLSFYRPDDAPIMQTWIDAAHAGWEVLNAEPEPVTRDSDDMGKMTGDPYLDGGW